MNHLCERNARDAPHHAQDAAPSLNDATPNACFFGPGAIFKLIFCPALDNGQCWTKNKLKKCPAPRLHFYPPAHALRTPVPRFHGPRRFHPSRPSARPCRRASPPAGAPTSAETPPRDPTTVTFSRRPRVSFSFQIRTNTTCYGVLGAKTTQAA